MSKEGESKEKKQMRANESQSTDKISSPPSFPLPRHLSMIG